MKHIENYFSNVIQSVNNLDKKKILKIIELLKNLRSKSGRLFLIGVGGSAGNASHAVNDFRKLCNIDAYTPVDNISEITAKTNDEGFDTIFDSYLKLCKINRKDILMVFSVGGGSQKKNVSVNLIKAIKYAKTKKTKIISVVGKTDGYAYKKLITPISETFQVLIWHLFVSHPVLQFNDTKW